MTTFYDYAAPNSFATNAACPERPAWQLSPVGYKWAQAVFEDCTQRRKCNIKKEVQAVPGPDKILEKILFLLARTVSISGRQIRKLSWMSVF